MTQMEEIAIVLEKQNQTIKTLAEIINNQKVIIQEKQDIIDLCKKIIETDERLFEEKIKLALMPSLN